MIKYIIALIVGVVLFFGGYGFGNNQGYKDGYKQGWTEGRVNFAATVLKHSKKNTKRRT